jgi:uncharacterized protein (DUF2062 family)
MLFKRRTSLGFWGRVKAFFWPRKSFWRSVRYYSKRVLRLTATPHAIAAGVAAGAFASFLPYLGFHFILAGVIAWCLRGNLIASALGTAVGNPITFPFIWATTLAAGRFILYGRHPEEIVPLQLGRALSHLDFASLWTPLLKPMTVGAIPVGGLCALLLYVLTRYATAAFQEARRQRLAAKARGRATTVVVTEPLRG